MVTLELCSKPSDISLLSSVVYISSIISIWGTRALREDQGDQMEFEPSERIAWDHRTRVSPSSRVYMANIIWFTTRPKEELYSSISHTT